MIFTEFRFQDDAFNEFFKLFNYSDHDDLLNFEIAESDFADGTLNEDELLLSDEGEKVKKKVFHIAK